MKRVRELTDKISGSGCFRTKMFAYTSQAPAPASGVINEVLGEHRPDIGVSDFSRAQKNHPAPQWQVCLAHQLRDCQYAIDALDRIFAPAMKRLLLRAFIIHRRR
jgi:transposase